jgi:hypothetical protein
MTDHRTPDHLTGRSRRNLDAGSSMLQTADKSRGSSNLVTIPRAGNLSTDTRAGKPG